MTSSMLRPFNRTAALVLLVTAIALGALAPGASATTPSPGWAITSVPLPTNFVPGGAGSQEYEVRAFNTGAAATDGSPIRIIDTLPAGLTVKGVHMFLRDTENLDYGETACEVEEASGPAVVTCMISEELVTQYPSAVEPATLQPDEEIELSISVATDSKAGGELQNSIQVEGGGAPAVSTVSRNEASAAPARRGLVLLRSDLFGAGGQIERQAGAHPYQYVTNYAVATERSSVNSGIPNVAAGGDVRDVKVDLPPGLIGNPTATSTCAPEDFNKIVLEHKGPGGNYLPNSCPPGSVVGFIEIEQENGSSSKLTIPVYNLLPPVGMPAQFGFLIAGAPVYINTRVRTGSDYGITAYLDNISNINLVTAARLVLWGTPAAAEHDRLRGKCLIEKTTSGFGLSLGECPAGTAPKPFFRSPTDCAASPETSFQYDNWPDPGAFSDESVSAPTPIGCERLGFAPTISMRPSTGVADSPSGLEFDLHLPQTETPEGLATADLRDATVAFPPGYTVDPSSADGLAACSPAQIGLTSAVGASPVTFSEAAPGCPDGSKIGSVEVDTPLLDHPVLGGVYVAQQQQNPFGSLIAVYIAAYDPLTGVVLKLPGRVGLDPATGQVVTRFEENPQLPFEDLKVDLFGGPRAALRSPGSCGAYVTRSDLRPWSAPASGPDATPSSSSSISTGPDGSCPDGAFDPKLSAGTTNPTAGAYSPFTLRLTREDGTQQLATLAVRLPKGLLGSLRGIPYCPDSALAAISEVEGTGAEQLERPNCPSASRVGSVTVGAGAGPDPLYVSTGSAYLAGPYKGAPLSLAIVTPALAGPFDLGSVVVRTALHVDPESTQITAVSDLLPTVLHGIPLDLRDVRVNLDRPGFTLNPTSCATKKVAATITGTAGGQTDPVEPFTVAGCNRLGFRPGLTLRLKGGTTRHEFPALTAVVTYPKKGAYANVSRASVALPHSEFLEQGHIGTVCTRVQFSAGDEPGEDCPKASIYGKARAFSPLLDRPLEGPVVLRSSSHTLPDLVADLKGQIDVVLDGRIDSVHGGIRTTFEGVPDAPVSRFVLALKGGKKGLLTNSTDICRSTSRASVVFDAQSGAVRSFKSPLNARCRGSHRAKK